MRKLAISLWLAPFAASAAPAYSQQVYSVLGPPQGDEYADEWPLVGGNGYTKIGSWVVSIGVMILDGSSDKTATLHRHEIDTSAPVIVKPKPRPRLGQPAQPEPSDPARAAPKPYPERIAEATAFLQGLSTPFAQEWNSPTKASEALEWAHEIDAEGVFVVSKRTGMISIESLRDTPLAEKLAQRALILNDGSEAPNTPITSTPAELNRLREHLIALGPLEIPSTLQRLPGETLRIRLLFKVVAIGEKDPPSSGGLRHPGSLEGKSDSRSPARAVAHADPAPGHRLDLTQHKDASDPVFQYTIACRYLEGDGMARDPVLAQYWFQQAAEQGYAPAQRQLGLMYDLGRGVPQDPAKAMFWYRKAIEAGDENALYSMGCMYQNGNGVPRDEVEATRWFQRLADLGSPLGQSAIAARYACGMGIEKDLVKAFQWQLKAAEQGYDSAEFAVAEMYEQGLGVPQDLIEALAWYNLSPISWRDETNQCERLVPMLGPEATLKAQRRADELRQKIAARKSQPAN